MSAAAPTTDATALLPADYADRVKALEERTVPALKALGLKVGVTFAAGDTKGPIIAALAPNDDAMRAFGWSALEADPAPESTPEAGTGDVDAQGDVIGQAPTDPYNCDDDGFPSESTDVAKLEQEHRDALVFWIESNQDVVAPEFATSDAQVAWIVATAYEQEEQAAVVTGDGTGEALPDADATTQGDDPLEHAPKPHIPTAAPAPTTQKVCTKCDGAGGWQTDAEWESCSQCCTEDDGQLTLVPGGAKPEKSILNVASLRVDLGKVQYAKGDRIRVSFEIPIDTVAFPPEREGKKVVREMRTHTGRIDVNTVVVETA